MKNLHYTIFKNPVFSISFLSLTLLVVGVSLFHQTKVFQSYKESVKHSYIEITYKAASPKGEVGGVTLPASCESDYYHPTGGAWPRPDGYGTNVSSANKLEAGWVKKISNNWCVRNDAGQPLFLNSDHDNFINAAPGAAKTTTGDL
jgi:hypothetical protein